MLDGGVWLLPARAGKLLRLGRPPSRSFGRWRLGRASRVDPSQHVVLVPAEATAVGQLERTGDQVLVLGIRSASANRRFCLPDEGGQLPDEKNLRQVAGNGDRGC